MSRRAFGLEPPTKTYATEAALCADFIAEATREGRWVCYGETEGWDILAVRCSDGLQIGIEAKLSLNSTVVEQALEDSGGRWSERRGPDHRAVLVPFDKGSFSRKLCAYLGLTILELRHYETRNNGIETEIYPGLPGERPRRFGCYGDEWHDLCPTARLPLPAYVPDCAAGSPCPTRLTPWKIGAIKIAIILETRPVTREDFRAIGIDHRRWLPSVAAWLAPAGERGSGWIAGPGIPDFRRQHPRNYDESKADAVKWMPSPPPLLATTQGCLV